MHSRSTDRSQTKAERRDAAGEFDMDRGCEVLDSEEFGCTFVAPSAIHINGLKILSFLLVREGDWPIIVGPLEVEYSEDLSRSDQSATGCPTCGEHHPFLTEEVVNFAALVGRDFAPCGVQTGSGMCTATEAADPCLLPFIWQDIIGCARCRGDGHVGLKFFKFLHPIEEDSGTLLTHWAMCPTVHEPILLGPILLGTNQKENA